MRKIDIHTHILPPEIPAFKERFGYGGFVRLDHSSPCGCRMVLDDGTFFRDIEKNCFDIPTRIKDCDELEVDMQVLSTVPVMFSYWAPARDALVVSQFLNDHISETIQAHPERFLGLGTIPLQDPELSCRELERCMNELKLSGVQIGSHINGKNLDDASLFPFYETAEKLGAAIFIHPWDMAGKNRMDKYFLPWLVGMPMETTLAITSLIFGGILDRFPKLRFAFAHGGGSFPYTLGRIQKGHQARPDLCDVNGVQNPRHYLGRFFVDSLVFDPMALEFLIRTVGVDSVLLGTDYPFAMREAKPGEAISQTPGLEKQDLEKLYFKNALRWLGKNV